MSYEPYLFLTKHLSMIGKCLPFVVMNGPYKDTCYDALVENMVKKNRTRFPIAVLLTTVLKGVFFLKKITILSHCHSRLQLLLYSLMIFPNLV